jgi:excinuclease ABC subunit A
VLHKLRDDGNTVVVIEHNLDVIKTADWVVDLGPEGGHRGGQIIAEGTPEQVAAMPQSHTGHFLARLLETKLPEPAAPKPERKLARKATTHLPKPLPRKGASTKAAEADAKVRAELMKAGSKHADSEAVEATPPRAKKTASKQAPKKKGAKA